MPSNPSNTGQPADSQDRTPFGWRAFWFSPIPPLGFHALRIMAGLLFLFWLLPFAGHVPEFFSNQGWFDEEARETALRGPTGLLPTGWSLLNWFGSPQALPWFFWLSILVLALFTLGLWTRLTSILTWIVAASFIVNPGTYYDADYLLALLAFYLMVGYAFLGLWSRPLSGSERILGPRDTFLWYAWKSREPAPPSHAANLALRLFQVNFVLVILGSAFHKMQFGEWWAGVSLWFPLHPAGTSLESIRDESQNAIRVLFFHSLAQYLVLAWQFSFPVFAWSRRWRPLLLGGGILAWIASSWIYRQPLYGPFYFIGCLSFLTPEEWQVLWSGIQRRVGSFRNQETLAKKERLPARTTSAH